MVGRWVGLEPIFESLACYSLILMVRRAGLKISGLAVHGFHQRLFSDLQNEGLELSTPSTRMRRRARWLGPKKSSATDHKRLE